MANQNVLERKPPRAVGFTPEPLLDTEQAAAIVQIHPKTLQKFARAGQIQGIHIGKLWRFRMSALEAWLDSQTGT
jgi:excisionase family DNA binding protein